LLFDDGSWGE